MMLLNTFRIEKCKFIFDFDFFVFLEISISKFNWFELRLAKNFAMGALHVVEKTFYTLNILF